MSLDNPMVRRIKGPTITTASGAYFDFEDPDSCPITRFDIAHALSNICRFTGHCHEFYSVAQHSVLVSYIVPKEDALAGLLHDAAEAFTGDVSKPLKSILPDFRVIEERVERSVLGRFGISLPLPESVKKADMIMLRTEQRDLTKCGQDNWVYLEGFDPLKIKIEPLSPTAARYRFLERWEELDPVDSCTFPNCGCPEARLCNARNPNSRAMALNNFKK